MKKILKLTFLIAVTGVVAIVGAATDLSKVESLIEPADDDDAAVPFEIALGEALNFPWEPSFLIDDVTQPASMSTSLVYGSCSQTCAPCQLGVPNSCPTFLGRPQQCMQQCP